MHTLSAVARQCPPWIALAGLPTCIVVHASPLPSVSIQSQILPPILGLEFWYSETPPFSLCTGTSSPLLLCMPASSATLRPSLHLSGRCQAAFRLTGQIPPWSQGRQPWRKVCPSDVLVSPVATILGTHTTPRPIPRLPPKLAQTLPKVSVFSRETPFPSSEALELGSIEW